MRSRPFLVVMLLAVWTCRPAETREPPSLDSAELVLTGFDSLRLRLEDGAGELRGEDGVLRVRGALTEWRLVSDLDADGRIDALVVAWSTGGGSGTFVELVHFVLRDGATPVWRWAGSVPLGDRVRVRAMTETSGRVEVHLSEHGPDDPLCCPSVDTVRAFRLREGALVPSASDP